MTITNYQQRYYPFSDENILKEILDFIVPIGTEHEQLLSNRMLSLSTINKFFRNTTKQLLAKRPYLLQRELLLLQSWNKLDPTNLRILTKRYERVHTLFFTHYYHSKTRQFSFDNSYLILNTFNKVNNITIDDPSIQILHILTLYNNIKNIFLTFSTPTHFALADPISTRLIALKKLNDVQSLSLIFNRELSDTTLSILTEIPNITQLHLYTASMITDRGLELLSKLKKLSSFILSGKFNRNNWITDQGTQQLEQINSLTTLTLYQHPEITAITFQQLQSLPQLQSLVITRCEKISAKNAWSKPLEFPMLESLKIDFSFSTDKNEEIDIIRPSFPKLKFLTFLETNFINTDIQYIEKLQLQKLTIEECFFNNICPSFEKIASKKIVFLDCRNFDHHVLNSELFIQFLKNHQTIQPKFKLTIDDILPNDFTLDRFVTKKFMQNMQQLHLNGSLNYKTLLKLTQDDGLMNPSLISVIDLSTTIFTLTPTQLNSLFLVFPEVHRLYVHSDYFQNDYIPIFHEHLIKKDNYKLIHVIHNLLKKEEILSSTHEIQTNFAIDLSYSKNISKDDFESINQYDNLQSINFSYCEFFDDELLKIVINSNFIEKFKKNEEFEKFEEINCSFCPKITDDAIIHLLKLQTSIKYHFQGCLITDKSLDAIIKNFTGQQETLFFDFRQCIHISEKKLLELKNFQEQNFTTIHSDYAL